MLSYLEILSEIYKYIHCGMLPWRKCFMIWLSFRRFCGLGINDPLFDEAILYRLRALDSPPHPTSFHDTRSSQAYHNNNQSRKNIYKVDHQKEDRS